MKAQHRTATLVAALTLLTVSSCRSSDEETGMPAMLKIRFVTEMKTILTDVRRAEETAHTLGDRYLGLNELRGQYLSRSVPESYQLTLTDVTDSSYRAQVTHKASGLTCKLEVGSGQGSENPTCD